ncbi:carbohydrate ABC transporter permease [Amnibacterium sp. CER49]|uniref:carbohydrate ABC transporter permease n=1 Tax=Amnibacterium sp. CER49 TaxID=3039161 RepID=UPI00244D0140|nr:carbohydrate ABC transporter permease [Amnibacterium sp. CER49]MDH2443322.1 carbohydrate ABC transporter permease [Amnibacterium sp. CER49]
MSVATAKPRPDADGAGRNRAYPLATLIRRRGKRAVLKGAAYVILLALSAFVLLPVAWMLTAALKPDLVSVFTVTPQWLPTDHWDWVNFRRALFDTLPFARYTFNTLVIAGGNILGTLISCSLVAYGFARLRFRGSGPLFYVLIVTMLIPWQALMVPQFLMFFKIGWYGTILPLIAPAFGGTAFYIFLIRQYMRTIPRELDEAALVDGLNRWQIFWRIVLPLSTPVLTVCAVFTFIYNWNNLLGPLIYLNNDSQFTIPIGLANLVTRAGTPWNLLMAANLLSIIPPVVIYFVVQRKLIGGIASVGLKG